MRAITLTAMLVATVAAVACRDTTATAPSTTSVDGVITLDDNAQRQAGITVAAVEVTLKAQHTEAPGIIALDERHTARIGSLVEGILLETIADVGDRVTAGQVLATLHSAVVHESWARYRKAVADRRRLEKELTFALAAYDRATRLYGDKAISLHEVQRAEADRVAAEESLDMGRTEVRRSEEELEHLGITNADDPTGESGERIPVRTPMAGVVLERLVTPGTAVTPGTPLYVVSNLSTLWALIEIDESQLPHVRVGQPITVRVAAYPQHPFAGVVALVGDIVSHKTHRVTVRCVLDNTDGRLKPQMYATASIREGEPRPAVTVPAGAIQTVEGRPTVFVAETGGRFRPRAIAIGREDGGLVDVSSGLDAGERVAVTGSFILKSELLKKRPEE